MAFNAVAGAASVANASTTAASTASAATSLAPSLASSPHVIGSAWVISSAILTTYSTTRFLKYGEDAITSIPVPSTTNKDINSTTLSGRVNHPSRRNRRSSEQSSSSSSSISVTRVSRTSNLSRPALLTLYRFSGSLLLGLLVHPQIARLPHRIEQTLTSIPDFIIPAAFLFGANYCNSVALDRIGISLTYTSKCGIPLITVLLTLLLDGIKAMPPLSALLSLIPIALGIGAASWNSPTFETWGFIAAIASCASQSALNVSSKRVMMKTGVSGIDAQRTMVAAALGITLLGTVVSDVMRAWKQSREEKKGEKNKFQSSASSSSSSVSPVKSKLSTPPPLWLSCFAVTSYHVEYVLSFMFVRLVEPITYGTCDAVRRLCIIIAGRLMFGGAPFSTLNLLGIGLALLGALSYSITSTGGLSGK